MDIGETLKLIRENKGLSQRAFAQNILSHSYYSKVESGGSQISAELLFKLLNKVDVTLSEFYFINSGFKSEQQISMFEEIKLYVHQYNLEDLETLYHSLNHSETPLYSYLVNNIFNSLSGFPTNKDEINKIKIYLLDIPTWGHFEFQLFSLCTLFMPLKMLLNLSIHLARNISTYEKFPGYEQDIFMISVNLGRVCIEENQIDKASYFLQLARNFNNNPEYVNERLLLIYFEALLFIKTGKLEEGTKKAKEIINIYHIIERPIIAEKLDILLENILLTEN